MSSSGPGSVLVFLSFVILSSLLFGIYMTAYLGTIYAGEEVGKKGEAAVEQALIYLFQHPTNVSIVDGSPVPKGETRIAIQNVGPREISYDRILAIGKNGDVVADVKVPGNKGLGARQWQIYRVQDLGLPERWNNFTVFQSEVSRIVLLSERGRTHGSIWGVPPFLEGIFRATLSTITTTSYIYNYIETRSYTTTYTVTIPARQSAYSLTGEWWEGESKVTSASGRGAGEYLSYYSSFGSCSGCIEYYWQAQGPYASALVAHITVNNQQILSLDAPPIIRYFNAGEQVTARVSDHVISYSISWSSQSCYPRSGCYCPYENRRCENPEELQCYSYCEVHYREGGATYRFQAIELVDWDTGEVYASVNQTSFTFNITRNTIVRFKYVLVSSWSRSWVVIQPPPEPEPDRCPEILNTKQPGDREWCACAKKLDPEAYRKHCIDDNYRSCLEVSVYPCCSGDEIFACLNSWSGGRGSQCVYYTLQEAQQGVTKTITVSWGASWSLKDGWEYHHMIRAGSSGPDCRIQNRSQSSVSGYCTITTGVNRNYLIRLTVIFIKKQ